MSKLDRNRTPETRALLPKTHSETDKSPGVAAQLPFDPAMLFMGGTTDSQAETLQRLDGTSQQVAVQRISETQGNRHLQRVVDVVHSYSDTGDSVARRHSAAGAVQAKLDVSEPDDPLELEADAVADEVMHMSVPPLSPPAAPGDEDAGGDGSAGGNGTPGASSGGGAPSSGAPSSGAPSGGDVRSRDLSAHGVGVRAMRGTGTLIRMRANRYAQDLARADLGHGEHRVARSGAMPFDLSETSAAGVSLAESKVNRCMAGSCRAEEAALKLHLRRQDVESVDLKSFSPHGKLNRCPSPDCRAEEAALKLDVQRAEEQNADPGVSSDIEDKVRALQGGGSPLPDTERAFFEPRLGKDLSEVRIHTDRDAAKLSEDLGARAFAVGGDIAFGDGEFKPGTEGGRWLMAHELAHVIQQGVAKPLKGGAPDEAGSLPETLPGDDQADEAMPADEAAEAAKDASAAKEAPAEGEPGARDPSAENARLGEPPSQEDAAVSTEEAAANENFVDEQKAALEDALAGRAEPLATAAEGFRTRPLGEAAGILVDQASRTSPSELPVPLGVPTQEQAEREPGFEQAGFTPVPENVEEVVKAVRESTAPSQAVTDAEADGFQALSSQVPEQVVPSAEIVDPTKIAAPEAGGQETATGATAGTETTGAEEPGVVAEEKQKPVAAAPPEPVLEPDLAQNPDYESKTYQQQSREGRNGLTDAGSPPNLDVSRQYRTVELDQQRAAADLKVETRAFETEAIIRADYGQHSIYPSEENGFVELEDGEGGVVGSLRGVEEFVEAELEAAGAEVAEDDPDALCREDWEKRQEELEAEQEDLEEERVELEEEEVGHTAGEERIAQEEEGVQAQALALRKQKSDHLREEHAVRSGKQALEGRRRELAQKQKDPASGPAAAAERAQIEAEAARLQQRDVQVKQAEAQRKQRLKQTRSQELSLRERRAQHESAGEMLKERLSAHDERKEWLEEALAALEEEMAAGCKKGQEGGGGGGGAAAALAEDEAALAAQQAALKKEQQELEARRAYLAEQVAYDAAAVMAAAVTENQTLLASFATLSTQIDLEAQAEIAEMLAKAETDSQAILAKAEADAEARQKQGEIDAEKAIRDAEAQAAGLPEEVDPGPIIAGGHAAAQRILAAMQADVDGIIETAQTEVEKLLQDVEIAAGLRTEEAAADQDTLATETDLASTEIADQASVDVGMVVDDGVQEMDAAVVDSEVRTAEIVNTALPGETVLEDDGGYSALVASGYSSVDEPAADVPPAPALPATSNLGTYYANLYGGHGPNIEPEEAVTADDSYTTYLPYVSNNAPVENPTAETTQPPYTTYLPYVSNNAPVENPAAETTQPPYTTYLPYVSNNVPVENPAAETTQPPYTTYLPYVSNNVPTDNPASSVPEGMPVTGDPASQANFQIQNAWNGLTLEQQYLPPAQQASLLLASLNNIEALQPPAPVDPATLQGTSWMYADEKTLHDLFSPDRSQDQVRMIVEAVQDIEGLPEEVRTEVIWQAAGFDSQETREALNASVMQSASLPPIQQADVLLTTLETMPGFDSLPPTEQAKVMQQFVVSGLPGVPEEVRGTVAMSFMGEVEDDVAYAMSQAYAAGDEAQMEAYRNDIDFLAAMHESLGNDFISNAAGFTPEMIDAYMEDLGSNLDAFRQFGNDPDRDGRGIVSDLTGISQNTGFLVPGDLPATPMEALQGLQGVDPDNQLISIIDGGKVPDEAFTFDMQQITEEIGGFDQTLVDGRSFDQSTPAAQAEILVGALQNSPSFSSLTPAQQAVATVTLVEQLPGLSWEARGTATTEMLDAINRNLMSQVIDTVTETGDVETLRQAYLQLEQVNSIYATVAPAYVANFAGYNPAMAEQYRTNLVNSQNEGLDVVAGLVGDSVDGFYDLGGIDLGNVKQSDWPIVQELANAAAFLGANDEDLAALPSPTNTWTDEGDRLFSMGKYSQDIWSSTPENRPAADATVTQANFQIQDAWGELTPEQQQLPPAEQAALLLASINDVDVLTPQMPVDPSTLQGTSWMYADEETLRTLFTPVRDQDQVRMIIDAVQDIEGLPDEVRTEIIWQAAGLDSQEARKALNTSVMQSASMSPMQQADAVLATLQSMPGFDNLPPAQQAEAMYQLVVLELPDMPERAKGAVALTFMSDVEGDVVFAMNQAYAAGDTALMETYREDIDALSVMHEFIGKDFINRAVGFTPEEINNYLQDLNEGLADFRAFGEDPSRGGGGIVSGMAGIARNTGFMIPSDLPVTPTEALNGLPGVDGELSEDSMQELMSDIDGFDTALLVEGRSFAGMTDIEQDRILAEAGVTRSAFDTMSLADQASALQNGGVTVSSFAEITSSEQAELLEETLLNSPTFIDLSPVQQAAAAVQLIEQLPGLSWEAKGIATTAMLDEINEAIMTEAVDVIVMTGGEDGADQLDVIIDQLEQVNSIYTAVAPAYMSHFAGLNSDMITTYEDDLTQAIVAGIGALGTVRDLNIANPDYAPLGSQDGFDNNLDAYNAFRNSGRPWLQVLQVAMNYLGASDDQMSGIFNCSSRDELPLSEISQNMWLNIPEDRLLTDPSFNAGMVARQAYQALETDKGQFFDLLDDLDPAELQATFDAFAHYSPRRLDEWEGLNLAEQARLQALMQGNVPLSDAIALRNSDPDAMVELLRNRSEEDIEAINQMYLAEYDQPLSEYLGETLEDTDLNRVNAMLAGNTALADAIAIDQALENGEYDVIEAIYERNRREVMAEAQAAALLPIPEGATPQENPLSPEYLEEQIRQRNLSIEAAYQAYNTGVFDGTAMDGEVPALSLADGQPSLLDQAFNGVADEYATMEELAQRDLLMALADYDTAQIDVTRMIIAGETYDEDMKLQLLRTQYDRSREAVYSELIYDFYQNNQAMLGGATPEQIEQAWLALLGNDAYKQEVDALVEQRASDNMVLFNQTVDYQYADYYYTTFGGDEGLRRQQESLSRGHGPTGEEPDPQALYEAIQAGDTGAVQSMFCNIGDLQQFEQDYQAYVASQDGTDAIVPDNALGADLLPFLMNTAVRPTTFASSDGYTQELAGKLIESGGYLPPEEELDYAIKRGDEDMVNAILYSAEDPVALADAYAAQPDCGVLYDALDDFNFGEPDDKRDALLILEGASTPEDQLRILQRRVDQEMDSGLATHFLDRSGLQERSLMSNSLFETEAAYYRWQIANEQLGPDSPVTQRAGLQFEQAMGRTNFDIDQHRSAENTLSNQAGGMAGMVVGLGAVALMVVFPPAGGPMVVAALSSMAGSAASMATQAVMEGDAYGGNEVKDDFGNALADLGISMVTAGLGERLFRWQLLQGLAEKYPGATDFAGEVIEETIAAGLEMVASMPEEYWARHLANLPVEIATEVLLGQAMGVGFDALGEYSAARRRGDLHFNMENSSNGGYLRVSEVEGGPRAHSARVSDTSQAVTEVITSGENPIGIRVSQRPDGGYDVGVAGDTFTNVRSSETGEALIYRGHRLVGKVGVDGTVVTYNPTSTTEVRFDGSRTDTFLLGEGADAETFPKAVTSTAPDGTVTSRLVSSDGTSVDIPAGLAPQLQGRPDLVESMLVSSAAAADGTTHYWNADGTPAGVKNADGSIVVYETDGSFTRFDPDGNTVTVRSDRDAIANELLNQPGATWDEDLGQVRYEQEGPDGEMQVIIYKPGNPAEGVPPMRIREMPGENGALVRDVMTFNTDGVPTEFRATMTTGDGKMVTTGSISMDAQVGSLYESHLDVLNDPRYPTSSYDAETGNLTVTRQVYADADGGNASQLTQSYAPDGAIASTVTLSGGTEIHWDSKGGLGVDGQGVTTNVKIVSDGVRVMQSDGAPVAMCCSDGTITLFNPDNSLTRIGPDGNSQTLNWNSPEITVGDTLAIYEAVNPYGTLSYADIKQRYADGQRLNPQTGRFNNVVDPLTNFDDVSTRYGQDAADAVEHYCEQGNIDVDDAMRVLNLHGQDGIEFLGKYVNGVDVATAAEVSGIPSDWLEGVRLLSENGDVVIGLRDANPLIDDQRGHVIPKTSGYVSVPEGVNLDVDTLKITSVPEVDQYGNPVHPPFVTNPTSGLVETQFEGPDGTTMSYIVVGEMDAQGQIIEGSLRLLPSKTVVNESGDIILPASEGMPMGADVDLYFTWGRTDNGYAHLNTDSPAEEQTRQILASLMSENGISSMTHGPYLSWAHTQPGLDWERGPGLVAIEGQLQWLDADEIEMLADLYGVSYPDGESLPTSPLVDDLIADTNPDFPLSVDNATMILSGPEGTVPMVAGQGGEGADVVFVDPRTGEVVLRREVKSIIGASQGTFNRTVSKAAAQVEYDGEVHIQVEGGRDVQQLLDSFRGSRSAPGAMDKYENIQIRIVDPEGNVLYEGPLNPTTSVSVTGDQGGPDLPPAGEQYLDLAEEAYEVYAPQLDESTAFLNNTFGDLGRVEGRAKRPESAANRLARASDNFDAEINDVDDAVDNIWDAIGTRVVLENGSAETVDQVVARLGEAIESGELQVIQINSLVGEGGIPYLTEEHLAYLQDIGDRSGLSMTTNMRTYESGYTVGTIYVVHANGVREEIQLIGQETLEIANAEHLVYDAFLNKPYLNAFAPEVQSQAAQLIEPIRQAAQSLDPSQQVEFNAYLNECYKNARRVESGLPPVPVELPGDFPDVLSIDHILEVSSDLESLH